jgi:hypothetical protein
MVERLKEKLDKLIIKKVKYFFSWEKIPGNDERLDIRSELAKICENNDMINDALDIAKHESSIYLPGVALITAVAALIISFSNYPLSSNLNAKIPDFIPFVFILALLFVIYIMCFIFLWMDVYYELIELKRIKREETKPTVISELDYIISEVEAMNQRIDNFEKNIRK